LRPWTVKIDGMVEKAQDVGIDDLVRKMPLEERLYRHRCVEAWGMAIPWTGFPLAKLVELAKPTSSAKYVRMETFLDKEMAPGQARQAGIRAFIFEGITMAEAMKRPRPSWSRRLWQAGVEVPGRPSAAGAAVEIRLQVHQVDHAGDVYGPAAEDFLGSPAGVRIRLLGERQSAGLPSALEPGDRASDRTSERRPTLLFNGYGEYVADLYKDLKGERLWA